MLRYIFKRLNKAVSVKYVGVCCVFIKIISVASIYRIFGVAVISTARLFDITQKRAHYNIWWCFRQVIAVYCSKKALTSRTHHAAPFAISSVQFRIVELFFDIIVSTTILIFLSVIHAATNPITERLTSNTSHLIDILQLVAKSSQLSESGNPVDVISISEGFPSGNTFVLYIFIYPYRLGFCLF